LCFPINNTEAHHDYSNLGELFEAAIVSQFYRVRAGDRFWYQLHLDEITCASELPPLNTRTLAQIIRDNSPFPVDIGDTVFVYDEKAHKSSSSGNKAKSDVYSVRKPRQ